MSTETRDQLDRNELRVLRYQAERGRAAAQAWATWRAADPADRDQEWDDLMTCLFVLAAEHGIEDPR